MSVVVYLLLFPLLAISKVKITDLSFFPCYEGGFKSTSGDTECKELSIDFSNTTCERYVYIETFFGTTYVSWTRTLKHQEVAPDCELYKNMVTKVAGDTLDYYSLLDDMTYMANCGRSNLQEYSNVMKCIEPLKQEVQECYSGVLLENGQITSDALQPKNVTARCGWWIVHIYNETKDSYDVKVISSHIHHTKEHHSCWVQMTNLVACVCEGDGCNNNIELLMERLMEMPFDLDRSGPMVFHNHNKFTTNQLTAEIAKIYSKDNKCEENCSMRVFYRMADNICEIFKFSLNHTEVIENVALIFMSCTFKGCSGTSNMQYLSYLTSTPRGMPPFCSKPLYIVDIVNYVTDDGWDVYWTEPKTLKKKRG